MMANICRRQAVQFSRVLRRLSHDQLPRCCTCHSTCASPLALWDGKHAIITTSKRTSWSTGQANTMSATQRSEDLTVAEMLDWLQHASLSLDGDTSACSALRRLAEQQYVELQSLPWLQSNMELARLQLVIGEMLESSMSPILTHAGFAHLLEVLDGQRDTMSADQLTLTLQYLTALGMDVIHPLVQRYLSACIDRFETLPLSALANFGYVFRNFPRGMRLAHVHAFLQRYAQLLDDTAGLAEIMDVLKNAGFYMSRQMYWRSLRVLAEISEQSEICDVRVITQLAYTGRRCYYIEPAQHATARRLLGIARAAALKNLDSFQPRDIAEVCSSLKLTQLYQTRVAQRFVDHSLRLLLKEGAAMRLCDVSNLLYSLCSNTNLGVRRQFEDAIYRRMLDADVVILSNLGETFYQMALANHDVSQRFESLVLRHAPRLLRYSTRLQLVLRFLSKHRFHSHADDDDFCRQLIHAIDERSMESNLMPSLAAYLLASPQEDYLSNPVVFKRIMAAVPRWPLTSLHRVVLAVADRNRFGISATSRAQLARIQHALHTAITRQLSSLPSLRSLLHLATSLSLHGRVDDTLLTDALVQLFPRFLTMTSDPADVIRVVQFFHQLRVRMPRVYDLLAAYITHNECVALSSAVNVLRACAQVSHTPANMHAFNAAIAAKLDVEDSVHQELRVLNHLSILGHFPEDRLQRVFTLDFVQKVDQYIIDNPKQRSETEDSMMRLNRTMLIECPQLNVPWFHEQYCRSLPQMPQNDLEKVTLKEEVEECLLEVLGDTKLLEADAVTPYYYTIDFECVLDSKGQAIPVKNATSKTNKIPQRVAVVIFTQKDFCYNSRQLVGHEQLRIRQLQMMGYKVIQISYLDWYSMGLTDWHAKVEYVKSKLFNSS